MKSLEDLNTRFEYTEDKLLDNWKVMENEVGPLKGDCDDYAVTVLWFYNFKSYLSMFTALLFRRARLINVLSHRGVPHCVLYIKGFGYICNIYRRFTPELKFQRRYDYPLPLVGLKLLLGKLL